MLVLNSALVDQHVAGTINLKYPRFCYETITRGATITASGTASGFFAQALANSLTREFWKADSLPGTVTVTNGAGAPMNYCGIAAHTLGTDSATVTLQYSDDDSTYVDVDSVSPSDDNPILFLFPMNNAVYWRLSITGTDAPSIGVWYIGKTLVAERGVYQGYDPIELSRKTILRPQMSESGQWIGRSKTRQSYSSPIAIDNLSSVWYRRYFEPFVQDIIENPYFFAWRPVPNLTSPSLIMDFAEQEYACQSAFTGETDGVGYVQTNEDIKPSNSGPRDLMSVTIPMEGLALT